MRLFRFSDTLEHRVRGHRLLVLLVLVVILNIVMGRWTEAILEAPGAGAALSLETPYVDGSGVEPELLDLQFWATAEEIHRLVSSYGPVGRTRYRWFSLTIDMIYPLVYSLFFAGLISVLYRADGSGRRSLVRLNLVPVAALVFDVLENAGVAVLLTAYPARLAGLARAVAVFTAAKWIFVAAAAILVVLGVLRLAFLRWKRGSVSLTVFIPIVLLVILTGLVPGVAGAQIPAQGTPTPGVPRVGAPKEPVPVLRLDQTVTGEVVTGAAPPQRTLYRIDVPRNAFALSLELSDTPADLDIVLRSTDDEIIALSESLLYDEVLYLTRYSTPALVPGEYLVEILYQYPHPPVVEDQVLTTIPFSFTPRAVIPPVRSTLRPGSSVGGTLKPEGGMIDLYRIAVTPGTAALRLDVSESVGDIDLVLNRGAPPWDLLSADAAGMSIRSTETLVLHESGIPPLVAGTWYVVILDQVSDTFPVDYRLTVHDGRDPPPLLQEPVTIPVSLEGVVDGLERAMLATVEVLGLEAGGSGVLVSSVGHIVTNLHVITAESGRVEEDLVVAMVHSLGEPPWELFRAVVLETDAGRDLALLQVVSGRYEQPLESTTSFPFLAPDGNSPPGIGDPLHVLGYPVIGGTGSRATVTYSRGSVAGFQQVPFGMLIKSDVVIGEGSSGGAALDSDYRLVGFPTEVVGSDSGRLAYIYPVHAIPREWLRIINAHVRPSAEVPKK